MELLESKRKLEASIDLKDFIQKSKQRLEHILRGSKIRTDIKSITLPNKSQSTITNINKDDPPLPESFMNNQYTVKLDQDELQKLLSNEIIKTPEKFSDLQVNFNCEQKLRIYEYVLERTGKFSEPELKIPISNEGTKSFAEIVASKNRERKQKLRRHRKSKPTHIEEVRSLVELQMQAMKQYIKEEKGEMSSERSKESKHKNTYKSGSHRSRSTDRRSGYSHNNYHRQDKSKRRTRSRSCDRHYNYSSTKQRESKAHYKSSNLNNKRRDGTESCRHNRSKSPDINKNSKKHKRSRSCSKSRDPNYDSRYKYKHYKDNKNKCPHVLNEKSEKHKRSRSRSRGSNYDSRHTYKKKHKYRD